MKNNDDEKDEKKVAAALARAESLTQEERSAIAKKAADARWKSDIPQATHEGEVRFGDIMVPCAVLPGGIRVLSERGVTKGFGLKRAGSNWQRDKEGGARLPVFASANNIKPFMSNDLKVALMSPIVYRQMSGQVANGFEARRVPEVCDVWLKARDAKVLKQQQAKMAIAADLVMRGLAHVGIIALVDEATGFQDDRAAAALQEIFEQFIRDELGKWAQRFPLEFYKHIYRLHGWEWSEKAIRRRPGVVGTWTSDLVYKRLAPGVLQKLREKTPRNSNGRRKHQYHRWLTEDVGHPRLQEHITAVLALMRLVDDGQWASFISMMNRALPIYSPQLTLFES